MIDDNNITSISGEITPILASIGVMPMGFAYHKVILNKNNKPIDYVYLSVNAEFENLTGLNREEIIGKPVTKVIPGIENDSVDWIGLYGKIALTGQKIKIKQYSKLLQRWYSITAFSPKQGYFSVIFTDITEEIETKKSLEESDKRIHKIFEDSPLGIIISNKSNNFKKINRRFCELLGYTEQELLKLSFTDIIHPDYIEEYLQEKEELEKGEISTYKTEKQYLKKNKEILWCSVTISLIRDDTGQEQYRIFMIEDISIRKQSEIATDLLNSLLRHDIGNKLTNLNFGLVLLEKTEQTAEQQKYFSIIHRSCKESMELTKKVNKLLRINQGLLEGEEIITQNLSSVLGKVIADYTEHGTERGITIDFDTVKEVYVSAGLLLSELFANLIENMIIHSNGTLLKIEIKEKKDHYIISFEDDGKGIPVTAKKKLFTREFKGEESQGLGLGLFLVKTIINSYGGNIKLKKSALGGVKFEVMLNKP